MHTKELILVNQKDGSFIKDISGNIIIRDIYDVDEVLYADEITNESYKLFRYRTNECEYSCITSSGLFFGKYSYLEYACVSRLTYSTYKFRKAHQYGIIEDSTGAILEKCIYDEIIALPCNELMNGELIKLRKSNSCFLRNVISKGVSKEYDLIYTPIQPLDKYIVSLNGKYGFISSDTLEEISDVTFPSIEKLCNKYLCDVNKYTKDLYNLNEQINPEGCCHFYDTELIDFSSPYVVNLLTGQPRSYCLKKHKGFDRWEDVWINIYGFFYDLFDCRLYDIVLYAVEKLYIVVKNGKYGIMDDEFHVIMPSEYKYISHVRRNHASQLPLFIVTTESGCFLYNAGTGLQTSEYDQIFYPNMTRRCYDDYLIVKTNGKYGLISLDGNIILEAKYDLAKHIMYSNQYYAHFYMTFHSKIYIFFVKNNKYYGIIPIEKYNSCVRIKNNGVYDTFYVAQKGEKYFLLNYLGQKYELPPVDDFIFGKYNSFLFDLGYISTPMSYSYIIGLINGKCCLYSIELGNEAYQVETIITDCDEMEFIEDENILCETGYEWPYIHFVKNGIDGYVNEDGDIISTYTYDEVKPVYIEDGSGNTLSYFIVSRFNKKGLLNSRRKVVLPCIYNNILKIYETYAVVIDDNGKVVNVDLLDTNTKDNHGFSRIKERNSFAKYNGSYAQDVMRWSDNDIEDILDGDPDAYWNID